MLIPEIQELNSMITKSRFPKMDGSHELDTTEAIQKTVIIHNKVKDLNKSRTSKLIEYHNRLKEVLETTGQITSEDLKMCLGLVSDDALEEVESKG